jgi:hypothetical protein
MVLQPKIHTVTASNITQVSIVLGPRNLAFFRALGVRGGILWDCIHMIILVC